MQRTWERDHPEERLDGKDFHLPTIKYQVIFPKYGENSARQLVYVNKERGRDPEIQRESEPVSRIVIDKGFGIGLRRRIAAAKAGGSIA